MDGSSRSTQSGGPRTQSELACNICLRCMPNSPVAACCGHVFCWPCLYRSWPQQGPDAQADPAITKSCPVCGNALREGFNIVPIYGYDNVASPRSGTERQTITGTTTAAAAASADTSTSSRPTAAAAAPVSTQIFPRPTAAAIFTATPRRPHSVAASIAARARAAAAPIPPRSAAATVPSDTDIPPRPNPPARVTQRQMDAVEGLHYLASATPLNDFLGEFFGFWARDRQPPSSSPARNIGLGVTSRSARRRIDRRLSLRGMDANGGNRSESHQERMDHVENEILARVARLRELIGVRTQLEDALIDYRIQREQFDRAY